MVHLWAKGVTQGCCTQRHLGIAENRYCSPHQPSNWTLVEIIVIYFHPLHYDVSKSCVNQPFGAAANSCLT